MTKRVSKLPKILRVPCPTLNKFIEINRITKTSVKGIIKKLKLLVEKSDIETLDINQYIKILIQETFSLEELKRMKDSFTKMSKADIQFNLVSYYNAIVDQYPILRIEYICSDVNGWSPDVIYDLIEHEPSIVDDNQFAELLKEEVSPKKKKKESKYDFSTLKSIESLEKFLKQNIIAQDEAIESICRAIKLKSVGFVETVTLFFLGKTGTGKTAVSRLLGEKYCENFYVINCSDFINGIEMNKLIGSPPGYVGYSEKPILKEKSDKSKRWVLLFDEIEKAHDKFFNWLLPLIETGKTYDNIGNLLDFSDSIFIFTSNIGVRDLKHSSVSFKENTISIEADKEELLKAIKREFSPEFINRIDEFVFFNPISKSDAKKITELSLRKYPIKKTEEIVEFISVNGFSDEYGARELNRFIKKNIGVPLADAILDNLSPGDNTNLYDATIHDGKLKIVNTIKR